MQFDDSRLNFELLDERLFPALRRLFAISVVIGPAVGLLEVWVLFIFSTHSHAFHFYPLVLFLLICMPVAYVLRFLPSALGAILLYLCVHSVRSRLVLYLQASLCGFSVLAGIVCTGQLLDGLFARRIEEFISPDPLDAVILSGVFGILPAIAVLFFFRRGMLGSAGPHVG